MITSVFKKSTPLNFSLVVFLILFFDFIYQIQDLSWSHSAILVAKKVGIGLLILFSALITNFISKRNGLSKDSAYSILFFLLFLLFFPSLFDDINLIFANFFILLAFRRLISLQSQKASKEKIFDASLWIFVASLFHFWCILYLVLVFISIISHVIGDYRNWLLPFIAFFAIVIIFTMYALVFNADVISYITRGIETNFSIDYFTNNYQNAALSIYATVALFFVISMVMTLSSRPLQLHASFKKLLFSFLIAVAIYIISADKSNDLLVFTIAPLAMMATAHIEMPQQKLNQELALGVLTLCSLFAFFSQL
ncbi:hypothetical protein SAMN05192550_0598 [Flavobacterium glycines]|jgi:hypothetical protein|uniref:Beta-carotene 15,15'-monooxygenase n=1 Tax=Flavobacterium glycines TaxID=551990 RepID=A0A1B9DNV7_9FLAO|nr:DUF6427 family protein [Flavobacterium glycines]OCB71353.1 hypothetical protein FBGL_08900 [Flavobacterium glycines]GEL10369.1 hypothetical protein FGL01_11080 [Flavobacterium glycines]SDI70841.1 hypothetical protein SAMN05192550_0598 [Flavobacterium glycines]